MDTKISVIIPAYNAERYISRCLDSILKQWFDGIEIIVIDDASIDKTKEILIHYQKMYPHIISIFQQSKNHRQGAARNIGIKNANGKYVLFIDSDDYINPNTLRKTYENAEANDSDIVFFGYEFLKKDGTVVKAYHVTPMCVGDMTDNKISALLSTSVVPWGKLIRRKLITDNSIFFPEDVPYEDHATTYLYYLYAKRTDFIADYLYVYCENENSTTNTINQAYHMKFLDMSLLLIDRIKKRGFGEKYREEIEFFCFEQMYILGIENILEKAVSLNVEGYLNKLLYAFKDNCSNIKNNKYYIRYASERSKNLLSKHEENLNGILYYIQSGYFNNYCPTYMKNIEESADKIGKFFLKKCKFVLWGAGNYIRNFVSLLEKKGIILDRVIDKNEDKFGKEYEEYKIEQPKSLENDEIIIVPYIGWIPDVLDILKKNEKKNLILNLEGFIKYDIENPVENYWEERWI